MPFWISSLVELISNNQFAGGGLVVLFTGSVLALCRRVPENLWNWFLNAFTVRVEILGKDEAFGWMQIWLARRLPKTRDVSVHTQHFLEETTDFSSPVDTRPKLFLTPAPGTHFFLHRGRPVWVDRIRKEQQGGLLGGALGGDPAKSESLSIRSFGRDRRFVEKLLEEARNFALPLDGKIDVRISSVGMASYWVLIDRIRPRDPASVILADNIYDELLKDMREFLQSYDWYCEMGIPYRRGYLLQGSPGNGKCLGKGTPILMFDGSIKRVEDVRKNDLLMGPDSKSRCVLGVCRGRESLYSVTPRKGDTYIVNESHILSLKMCKPNGPYGKGEIVNISVKDYLRESDTFKHCAKGYRAPVSFPGKPVLIDPYLLGLWLGDGTSSKPEITTADGPIVEFLEDAALGQGLCLRYGQASGKARGYSITSGQKGGGPTRVDRNFFLSSLKYYGLLNNKHIPFDYKTNDEKTRLAVLAGLMDADGSENCGGYDYITSSITLANDVLYLARSLGFAAYSYACEKSCPTAYGQFTGKYIRMSISGDLSKVPVRLDHKKCSKRQQIKDVLVTGIEVSEVGEGDYYGFELDKDGLFLLGDFTVTHNTSLVVALASALRMNVYILNLGAEGMSDEKLMSLLADVSNRSIILIEDVDCAFTKRSTPTTANKTRSGGDQNGQPFGGATPGAANENVALTFSGLLNALDGVSGKDGRIVFMTTNFVERLDAALIRDGRIDVRREIKNAQPDQIARMYRRFFPQAPAESATKFSHRFVPEEISMASLQGYLLRRRHDPNAALVEVSELINSQKPPASGNGIKWDNSYDMPSSMEASRR